MISQFFILSPRGDTVITRDYLGNVPKVVTGFAAAAAAQKCFSSTMSWL
jgi:hypothetical protein